MSDLPRRHRHGGQRLGLVADLTALRRHLLPCRRAHRNGRVRRARILHGRGEASGTAVAHREDRAAGAQRRRRIRRGDGRASRASFRGERHTGHGARHGVRSRGAVGAHGGRETARTQRAHGRRAIRERAGAPRLHAGGGDLETRHRRSLARRLEERRAVRRGRGLFRSRAGRGVRAAAQASGPSVVEAALSELPAARLSRGRLVAAQRRAGECDGNAACSRDWPSCRSRGCYRTSRRTSCSWHCRRS
jgi:hypothetical protein